VSALAPARNRVSPLGDIVAATGRGTWMGNRGRLHEGRGTRDVVRHHQSRAWITCALDFWGRRVAQWEPGHYTPLFFLDEAVALAAGHRPCAECRRPAYREFRDAAARHLGTARLLAPQLDRVLHEQRWDGVTRGRRLHELAWRDLPEGAFVLASSAGEPASSARAPALVRDDHLRRWLPDNSYGDRVPRPRRGTATVITPPATLAVLRAGYPVQLGDEPETWARPNP